MLSYIIADIEIRHGVNIIIFIHNRSKLMTVQLFDQRPFSTFRRKSILYLMKYKTALT